MDATTSILFEALSKGVPVIALDHLSFSEKINNSCGKKIEVKSPEQIAHDIANTINDYFSNEKLRYKTAEGAIAQAKNISWNTNIEKLNRLYSKILNPQE